MASSASMEQCFFTGGSFRWDAMSAFCDRSFQMATRYSAGIEGGTYRDGQAVVDLLADEPLGGHRRRGDGAAAAVRLELRVHDRTVVVDFHLQLHHIAASRSTDKTYAKETVGRSEPTGSNATTASFPPIHLPVPTLVLFLSKLPTLRGFS